MGVGGEEPSFRFLVKPKKPEPKMDHYCIWATNFRQPKLCSHAESGLRGRCAQMEKHCTASSSFPKCKMSEGDAELKGFVKCTDLRVGSINPLHAQRSHAILVKHTCAATDLCSANTQGAGSLLRAEEALAARRPAYRCVREARNSTMFIPDWKRLQILDHVSRVRMGGTNRET